MSTWLGWHEMRTFRRALLEQGLEQIVPTISFFKRKQHCAHPTHNKYINMDIEPTRHEIVIRIDTNNANTEKNVKQTFKKEKKYKKDHKRGRRGKKHKKRKYESESDSDSESESEEEEEIVLSTGWVVKPYQKRNLIKTPFCRFKSDARKRFLRSGGRKGDFYGKVSKMWKELDEETRAAYEDEYEIELTELSEKSPTLYERHIKRVSKEQ